MNSVDFGKTKSNYSLLFTKAKKKKITLAGLQ